MNIREIFKCKLCKSTTQCMIAFSARKEQIFRYVCKRCNSPIDVILKLNNKNSSWKIYTRGATRIRNLFSTPVDFFVELSMDYPTLDGKSKIGQTPFIRAFELIGAENMIDFQLYLVMLEANKKYSNDIVSLISLYLDEKWYLYEKLVRKYLPENAFPCNKMIDKNRCLYLILEIFFFPLIRHEDILLFLGPVFNEIDKLFHDVTTPFLKFLREITSSNYLKELQKDCLEIYPRILESELILRPALFCDFLDKKLNGQIPTRISVSSFNNYKDLFKDISEIISRLLVLVAGVCNLKLRGDHNIFNPNLRDIPRNLEEFVDVPFGKKEGLIDDLFWNNIAKQTIDNKLRNSIAHYKTEYNENSQVITYYPKREGFRRNEKKEMNFLDFSCNVLNKFRWLHRLHHLVKMLFIFYFSSQENQK